MRISTDELVRLVEDASVSAIGAEQLATRRATAAIRQAKTEADLASPRSRFLANVVETCRPFLKPTATERLGRVALYGIESPYANAIPQASSTGERIFVFGGLQHQIYYVINLLKVLERLQALRPEATCELEGRTLPEALGFSLAAFSILSDAMDSQRFPPVLQDMLGPVARYDATYGYWLSVAFVLLHELGHLELGHLGSRGVRSERPSVSLAEPEDLSAMQADELAADAFALDQIVLERRAELSPSLTFFFAPFAFMEAFGSLSANHPLAVNRLAALLDLIEMEDDVRRMLTGWIGDRLAALRRLARHHAINGTDLRARIAERVPLPEAYATLQAIKMRVACETGVLEMPGDATRRGEVPPI